MADTFFIEGLNTLPEQVQINKEDIKTNTTNIATNAEKIATNTSDITKLQDDIGKIKPNAWEERKFNFNLGEEGNVVFTTYNPITDANAPVNAQKSFINKDTYSITDVINSYSFFISGSLSGQSMSIYAVCTHPSNSLQDILDLDDQNKPAPSIVLITSKDETGKTSSSLNINCTKIKTDNIQSKSITIYNNNGSAKGIDSISDNDDTSFNTLLTAFAINEYYLKKTDASNTYLSKTDASNTYLTKTDASNTYLTKTDASNTYLTKQDYNERIDTGDIIFTAQGWNKFKAITDTEGQTIELKVPTDFLEHIQATGTNDLILQLVYNSHVVFGNVYLHPNNTIDDLDSIAGAKTTYYTGQAILTLSSQSNGLFYIVYQNGVGLTLHLITTL